MAELLLNDSLDLIRAKRRHRLAASLFKRLDADPDSPGIIYEYTESGLALAGLYGVQDDAKVQEALLLILFDALLSAAADPLRPRVFRLNCANEIYRPLHGIQAFYGRGSWGQEVLNTCFYEMNTLLRYTGL